MLASERGRFSDPSTLPSDLSASSYAHKVILIRFFCFRFFLREELFQRRLLLLWSRRRPPLRCQDSSEITRLHRCVGRSRCRKRISGPLGINLGEERKKKRAKGTTFSHTARRESRYFKPRLKQKPPARCVIVDRFSPSHTWTRPEFWVSGLNPRPQMCSELRPGV